MSPSFFLLSSPLLLPSFFLHLKTCPTLGEFLAEFMWDMNSLFSHVCPQLFAPLFIYPTNTGQAGQWLHWVHGLQGWTSIVLDLGVNTPGKEQRPHQLPPAAVDMWTGEVARRPRGRCVRDISPAKTLLGSPSLLHPLHQLSVQSRFQRQRHMPFI